MKVEHSMDDNVFLQYTCKNMNISSCNYCELGLTCQIAYFIEMMPYYLNMKKYIEEYFSNKNETVYGKTIQYFTKAVEIIHPEYLDTITKIKTLI